MEPEVNGLRPPAAVEPAHPASRQTLRPWRVVLFAWLLALVPIAMLQIAHADLHESHELPPILHWLRDGAFAVPLAAFAVLAAALVVGRRGGEGPASLRMHLAWALLACAIFAVLSVPANQIRKRSTRFRSRVTSRKRGRTMRS